MSFRAAGLSVGPAVLVLVSVSALCGVVSPDVGVSEAGGLLVGGAEVVSSGVGVGVGVSDGATAP
jgi:hypothetical protein